MKAHMTDKGRLVITPESRAEAVALKAWWGDYRAQQSIDVGGYWAVLEVSLPERDAGQQIEGGE